MIEVVVVLLACSAAAGPVVAGEVTASSEQPEFPARGAADGDRFAFGGSHAWAGEAKAGAWWWQREFSPPQAVGAILQVVGDHEFVFRNAPKR